MTPVVTPSLRPHAAGASAGHARLHNRKVVLGHVRALGQSGRAEIARISGLSTQAVSNIIAELENEGILISCGRVASGRGLPPLQYALNPAGGYALGIEVRPNAVLAALMDLSGSAVFTDRVAIADSTPGAVCAEVTALRDRALQRSGVASERLIGAGVVMPGPFGVTGLTDPGSALQGWSDTDPGALFAKALGVPVEIENDANAAALAEQITAQAAPLTSFAYLYFGTGLGLGIVSDGHIRRGAFGNAGEIGHIIVPSTAGPVRLEHAVSRLSAQKYLGEYGIKAQDSAALGALFDAADPMLDRWTQTAAPALGHAIATIENMLDPQTIILGGAMPDPLLDRLIALAPLPEASISNRPGRTLPRLMRGGSGRMTATLGAAALVLHQTFSPQIAA